MNPFVLALLFAPIPAAYHEAYALMVWISAYDSGPFSGVAYLGLALPISMLFSAFRWSCFKSISGIRPVHAGLRLGATMVMDLIFVGVWLSCLDVGFRLFPSAPALVIGVCAAGVFVLRWINFSLALSLFLHGFGAWSHRLHLPVAFGLVLAGSVIAQFCLQGSIVALYRHLGPLQDTFTTSLGALYVFYGIEALSHAVLCHFSVHPYPRGRTSWVRIRRPRTGDRSTTG